MSEVNLFETATRKKYRFVSAFGLISVEDLWSLALIDTPANKGLDGIARALFKELKEADDESFVRPKGTNEDLANRLEIVKHIINVKMSEQEANEKALLKAKEKQRLLEILHEKKDEDLKGLSVEELEKRIADL